MVGEGEEAVWNIEDVIVREIDWFDVVRALLTIVRNRCQELHVLQVRRVIGVIFGRRRRRVADANVNLIKFIQNGPFLVRIQTIGLFGEQNETIDEILNGSFRSIIERLNAMDRSVKRRSRAPT